MTRLTTISVSQLPKVLEEQKSTRLHSYANIIPKLPHLHNAKRVHKAQTILVRVPTHIPQEELNVLKNDSAFLEFEQLIMVLDE